MAAACPYGAPGPASEASSAVADAEKIVRVLSERATAARAEAVWAGGPAETAGAEAARRTGTATGTGEATARTGTPSPAAGATALDAAGRPGGHLGAEPLKSTWSGRAIAALVIPALILLVVWLV